MSSISNIHSPILASRQATGRLQISNLSAEVTRCALVSYFGQLGELVDVRLAPASTALVTYSDVETAQAVVGMESGHTIEGCPVLVEVASSYAVSNSATAELSGGSTFSGTNFSVHGHNGAHLSALATPTPDLNPQNYGEENTKLFVTQIPQHVTRRDILKYFKQFGKVRDIYMPYTVVPAGYPPQHKGIAFLAFRSKSLGEVVLQRAEYEVVPGVTVVVDKAKARNDPALSKSQKKVARAAGGTHTAAPY